MRTRSRLGAALLLSTLTAATWAVALPGPAAGATVIRVTSTGDKGDTDPGDGVCDTTASAATTRCTLRAAIQTANADPDLSIIRFRITSGSSATKTIQPLSPLPWITEPLEIDGYTQAGATPNSAGPGTNAVLRIALDGRYIRDAGLAATAAVEIRGLAIYWFGRGIQLSAGSEGSRILGNFIGTDATGTEDKGMDSFGVLVNAGNVRIGSIARGDRNLISGNTTSGIVLGTAASDASIQGNLIGTRKNGRRPMGNEGNGVSILGSQGHLIGGQFGGQGNVIAFNGGDGVALTTVGSLAPRGNRISSNSIFRNAGTGIDLADDGVTPNDPVPDKDGGPNGLQNFPKIASAAQVADGTVVRGSLASRRDTAFEIQLFASPAGDPEGKNLLVTFTVTTGADGKLTFNRKVGSLGLGILVTATATDLERDNTSEFGPGRAVTP